MQIQSIEKLKPGDILGKSLFNSRGDLLLASGYELNPETIELMKKRGILYVHVMTEVSKDIFPQEVISDTVRVMANRTAGEVFEAITQAGSLESENVENIQKRLQTDKKFKNVIKMPAVKRVVSTILEEVMNNSSVMFSSMRMRAEDSADYEHAIDTTVLSIMIAQLFRFSKIELRQLGVAAMLHDTGKAVLGNLRHKKSFELNADERMLLREHPVYSMLILQENNDGAFVEQITILQHHEQLDGNGFPRGLSGKSLPPTKQNQDNQGIHRFAHILAVANVYDNLISGTEDGTVLTPEEAITAIINRRVGSWNRHVVKALVRVVQCYPVGVVVHIKNNRSKRYIGYRGIVAKENEKEQSKPTLVLTHDAEGQEIAPQVVDFKDEKDMHLEIDS